MAMQYSDARTVVGKAQADGNQTISCSPHATEHQFSAQPSGGGVTGTLAVMVKAFGRSDFEALKDANGVAIVINLASASYDSVRASGNFVAVRFDPTSVTGGTYSAAACGWSN